MQAITNLRERARRYRQLAEAHQGNLARRMLDAADQLDYQADGLEAYAATARLTDGHAVTLNA